MCGEAGLSPGAARSDLANSASRGLLRALSRAVLVVVFRLSDYRYELVSSAKHLVNELVNTLACFAAFYSAVHSSSIGINL